MQIGEGLTGMKCLCKAVISALQIASLATSREILVAFWPKIGLRSDLRVPNYFSRGSMPPDPLVC